MTGGSKATVTTRKPGFSRKRIRQLYFSDGLYELFIFIPFAFYGWFRFARATEQASLMTFTMVSAVASFVILGFLLLTKQNKRRKVMGIKPSIILSQVCLVLFILGLYTYLEYQYTTGLPYISFIFLVIIWGALVYLSRNLAFYAYLGWVIFCFLLTRILVLKYGLDAAIFATTVYGYSVASLPVMTGLVRFIGYFILSGKPDFMETKAELSDGEGETSSCGAEQAPDIADFLKAEALMTQGRGSYFEDGVFEIFFGLLFTLTSVMHFLEVYSAGHVQAFTVMFYIVMGLALLLMVAWNIRKYKIVGTLVPGFEMIVGPVVFLAALLLGNIAGSIFVTAGIWIALFVAGAAWMKLRRYYTYAAWALVSCLASVLGGRIIAGSEARLNDMVSAYVIAFSLLLFVLGTVTAVHFNRKNLSGRADSIDPLISDANAKEAG